MGKKALTAGELRQELVGGAPPLVIDVRRAEDRETDAEGIPGSQWRDPVLLEDWAGGIPSGAKAVVYCVRGGGVSQSVQAALALRGVDARYVEGGLEAWRKD